MVEEGTILCVIEAMKLMNEIPSDTAGEVVRILVENSHPVEYGQKTHCHKAAQVGAAALPPCPNAYVQEDVGCEPG